MIDFDDRRWDGLEGGYRAPYDPRPALRALEAGENLEGTWDELWQELHHQSDVGEASYAAVPHLVRIQAGSGTVSWNVYALISTIELERHRICNPSLPDWLSDSYYASLSRLVEIGARDLGRTDDPLAIRSIIGAIALAKGQLELGAYISDADESEIDEALEARMAWSEFYEGA